MMHASFPPPAPPPSPPNSTHSCWRRDGGTEGCRLCVCLCLWRLSVRQRCLSVVALLLIPAADVTRTTTITNEGAGCCLCVLQGQGLCCVLHVHPEGKSAAASVGCPQGRLFRPTAFVLGACTVPRCTFYRRRVGSRCACCFVWCSAGAARAACKQKQTLPLLETLPFLEATARGQLDAALIGS